MLPSKHSSPSAIHYTHTHTHTDLSNLYAGARVCVSSKSTTTRVPQIHPPPLVICQGLVRQVHGWFIRAATRYARQGRLFDGSTLALTRSPFAFPADARVRALPPIPSTPSKIRHAVHLDPFSICTPRRWAQKNPPVYMRSQRFRHSGNGSASSAVDADALSAPPSSSVSGEPLLGMHIPTYR
ncbi:hypothetical protein LZ30DRAFT_728119 [Colletotrichum cereale]|nr:hypothetical protein LZ30DRAFT_740161 [Colletotrichum cereale]KAK1978741.1 hypothetical protein LZ30DRAFT_728119 [Colletotrichum cereale]